MKKITALIFAASLAVGGCVHVEHHKEKGPVVEHAPPGPGSYCSEHPGQCAGWCQDHPGQCEANYNWCNDHPVECDGWCKDHPDRCAR